MSKDLKTRLAQKIQENHQRHVSANQEVGVDLGRQLKKVAIDLIDQNPYQPRMQF